MRIKKGGNGCTFQSKEEIIYPFSNSFLRIISKIIIYLLLHETEYLHISRSTSDIPSRQKTHAAGHEMSSNRKRSTLSRISIKNEKETAAVSLKKELQCYENAGTRLYLNGRKSRADAIARACTCSEHSSYMRDFISDDAEHITEIHFIKISADQVK